LIKDFKYFDKGKQKFKRVW